MSHLKNNSFVKRAYYNISIFLNNFVETIKGFAFVVFLSSVRNIKNSKRLDRTKTTKKCIVLANGPSLKKAFEDAEVPYCENNVMCVNLFARSEYFWITKPRYYFVTDNSFFGPKRPVEYDNVDFLLETFKKVNWQMYLVVPCFADKCKLLSTMDNPKIQVVRLNIARFEGFKALSHFMYRSRMAMPLCQNVTNFAICTAINMHYDEIWLYGADASWTKDLYVNDDNVMCQGEAHVYEDKKEFKTTQFIGYTMASVFMSFSRSFHVHNLLNDYALSSGVKVLNRTRGSYIDAYPRDYNFS